MMQVFGVWRVNGVLSVARAFGDHNMKVQGVVHGKMVEWLQERPLFFLLVSLFLLELSLFQWCIFLFLYFFRKKCLGFFFSRVFPIFLFYGLLLFQHVLSLFCLISHIQPFSQSFVISDPDVHTFEVGGKEDFLVLACDGLWDVMSAGEVREGIRRKKKER